VRIAHENSAQDDIFVLVYPDRMSVSPTAEGFRAAFRRPSFAFAEIMWRWAIGATATALFFYGLFEYLRTLPVTDRELLLLRSRQPYLVSQALAHILRGSLGRVVASASIAAFMLAALWMIAASIGRLAIVRAMQDYFRAKFPREASPDEPSSGPAKSAAENHAELGSSWDSLMRPLFRLNFLRVAVALAAMLGLLGASILASFTSTATHPRPGLAFFLFLPLAALVGLAWSSLNWLLSLATMFAVRDGNDVIAAISAAVSFIRERTGAVFAVSTWTGVGHAAALMGATTVVSVPMSMAPVLPGRLVLAAMVLVTLIYFALVDWLYTARLAGYVCIAELPEALLRPAPPLMPQPLPQPLKPASAGMAAAPVPALQTTIDRNELILSDVPREPQTSIDRDELILSDRPALATEPGSTTTSSES
jgi:hypothetical protein